MTSHCRIIALSFAAALAAFIPPTRAAEPAAPPAPATRPASRPAGHNFAKWEKEISAYEAKDKTAMPEKGGAVFTGSSTIGRWKTLSQDFPGVNVINRGFGGSEIVDATHFADRIIVPYAPKQVFLRAGGNDIHAGKSAEQVFKDFQDFATTVREKLPDAEIVFISLSPAPSRWAERDENKKLNDMVKQYCADGKNLKYVETYDMTLTPDGKAREELFVADRLHFNAEGYKLLTERVKPFLAK